MNSELNGIWNSEDKRLFNTIVRTRRFRLVLGFSLSFFTLEAVRGNLLVVLFEGSQVLPSLGELALFHTLADVPVDEGTLGVHEIELVVQTVPCLRNGGRVGQHADGPVDRGELATGDTDRLLVVDTQLEASRAPLDQVERRLGLERCNGSIAVARHNVAAVQQGDGHVLAVARIADNHLVVGLEALEGDVVHLETLVRAAVARDDRGVRDERVVDPRERDQVRLELVQIDVQGAIESEARRDGADDLGNEAVEMLVARARDVQVATADVVNSLVIHQEGAVGVLDGAVCGEHRVVRLNDGSRDPRRRVDGELQLRLLPVVGRQTLEQQSTETRPSTTAERVEDQEALQGRAVI